MRLHPFIAFALLMGLPRAAGADGPELLPESHLRLLAARYQPTEKDLYWVGWIGGGAGILRQGRFTASLDAAVETTIGNTRRAFDATQANYHLTLGGRRDFAHGDVSFVFHHVSRHLVDDPKARSVDWNVLGARATRSFEGRVPIRLSLGVGHTVQDSLVGYRFEVLGGLDADLLTRRWGAVYLRGDVRGMTVEENPDLPRPGFVDGTVEGGLRFPRRAGVLAAFAAYEHRNDVLLLEPSVRDRALFGVRIDLENDRGRR